MSRRNRGHTSPRQHNNCQSRGAGGLVIKGLIYIPAQTYSPHRLFARMCLCASCQLQGDGSCCCSWMQKRKAQVPSSSGLRLARNRASSSPDDASFPRNPIRDGRGTWICPGGRDLPSSEFQWLC